MFIHYEHGRYGCWRHTFRFQHSDFELIGYDAVDHHGPIINRKVSISFSITRKLERENVNEPMEESGDEVFEETWPDIKMDQLPRLSEIEDFDKLNIGSWDFEIR